MGGFSAVGRWVSSVESVLGSEGYGFVASCKPALSSGFDFSMRLSNIP